MSPALIVALVALGFGAILVRRRSIAIFVVGTQAMLLGVAALTRAGHDETGLLVAGVILLVRGLALPALLVFVRRRTPEPRLVAPATTVLVRLSVAAVVALVIVASMPALGIGDRGAEQGALALLALGIAIVVLRRPALFQVLGLIVAENGAYLLAISAPGGVPAAIELGILFDLILIVTVAAAFARRIHGELGTGDTDVLRRLRD